MLHSYWKRIVLEILPYNYMLIHTIHLRTNAFMLVVMAFCNPEVVDFFLALSIRKILSNVPEQIFSPYQHILCFYPY